MTQLGYVVVASLVVASAAFSKIAGYTPVSDVSAQLTIGQQIEQFDAAVSATNWTVAQTLWQTVHSALHWSDASLKLKPAYSTYYGANTYAHDFVDAALKGTGTFALTDKARQELSMKGAVLQGVLMAVWSNLEKANSLCSANQLGVSDGAPHYVDRAWALYGGSEAKGPIKLAEKRAPQFAVETTPFTEAGNSKVNSNLLNFFKEMQSKAQSGDCASVKQLVSKSIAQMQVPVIQGMLREAYEVDPKEVEQHQGADGFIEVVEGWAFARAVLPAIHKCSPSAAKFIKDNMDTIGLGVNGKHLPSGYVAIKSAVQSTYECLGIKCTDVNAMVNPFKTGQMLWQPCTDGNIEGSFTTAASAATSSGTGSTTGANSDVSASMLQASVSAAAVAGVLVAQLVM